MATGHGTLLTGSDGQGNCTVYVSDNGGDKNYQSGKSESAVVSDGVKIAEGEVVTLDWNSGKNELNVTGHGNYAEGDVNSAGTKITITKSGDTSLSGSVTISDKYGSNKGYNSQAGVKCGNVDGEAAYLHS